MPHSDLLQLYFERSNALQSLWTLYVVIIGGLLAFASIRQRPDLVTTGLVTVLFLFFAYKNIGAIHDISVQRVAVLETLRAATGATPSIDATLQPAEYGGARNFHVVCDLLTVAALWAMERRRRRFAALAS